MRPPFLMQRGVTLLESLITLLILSVGLLGVAGLQARSMKDASVAASRAQVIFLMNDITERIRANPVGVKHYKENNSSGALKGCVDAGAEATQKSCSPKDLASEDIYYWHKHIQQVLGKRSPTHQISVNNDKKPAVITIKISWRASHQSNTKQHSIKFRL